MDCIYNTSEISYNNFYEQIHSRIISERIPFSGSFELTLRCNLKCRHCYCCPDLNKQELGTKQIKSILDEISAAGCLWLLISGGEPLLRPDFMDIYTYAKKKGLLITLFTNGTLLTSNLADFFLDFPPYAIEISLYGIREKTYELITGTNSSYNLCRKAIDLLLEKKLPLRLKTMVMQQNLDEVKEIEQFAKSLNVEFRFDAALNSRMNADSSPCTMRIPPEEVVRLDLAEEKRVEEWKKFITQYQDSDLNDKLYICSAGLCAFHIDPYGHLSPCVMARTPSYELLRGSFKDAWFNFIPNKILSLKLPKDNPCRACQIRALCNQCPGWSQFEHADNQTPVDYLCEISQLRAKALLPQFKMEKLMALNS